MPQNRDCCAKVLVAEAQFCSADSRNTTSAIQAWNIANFQDVNPIAREGNVNVQVSNTEKKQSSASGLTTNTTANITVATHAFECETNETRVTAKLNIVAHYQVTELVKAAIAVDKAKEQLEKAQKEYKARERNHAQLKTHLTQIKHDYKNKTRCVQ